MAKLPEYQSLQEKKTYFSQTIIETKEEFDNFYNYIQNNGQIWRGSNEAKYKIFTSLQRFWIENNKSNDIKEVVNYLKETFLYFKEWNKSTLINYLENIGMEKVPYTIFSILRHFNIPTPILDWTEDLNVALFFMTDGFSVQENGRQIDQYFTIYLISKEHPIHDIKSKKGVEEFVTDNKEDLQKQNKNEENFERNLSNALLISEELYFKGISKNILPVFKIHDAPDDNIKYFIRNNFNISNQKGLFVHNSDPIKPLEEYFYEKYMNLPLDQFSLNDKFELLVNNHINDFFSIEINKSLANFIQEKIEKIGITEDYIYPKLNKMKDDFYDYFR